jgi:hypothetical protein
MGNETVGTPPEPLRKPTHKDKVPWYTTSNSFRNIGRQSVQLSVTLGRAIRILRCEKKSTISSSLNVFPLFGLRTFRIWVQALLFIPLGDLTVGKVTFTNRQPVVRPGLKPDHPRKANHPEKDKGRSIAAEMLPRTTARLPKTAESNRFERIAQAIGLKRFRRLFADLDPVLPDPIRLWKCEPIGVLGYLSAKTERDLSAESPEMLRTLAQREQTGLNTKTLHSF